MPVRALRAWPALPVVAIVLAGAAAAPAQDASPPGGNYGGGAVLAPPASIEGAGNMLIGLRVTGTDRLRINASLGARCESPRFSTRLTLASGGTFADSGTRTTRLPGGRRVRTSFRVQGTVSGAMASGTARVSNTVRREGRRTRTCTSGTVRWSARRSTGDVGLPGVAPGVHMFGTTAQRLDGPRRAIALRVSADGAKLERALYDVTLKCPRATNTDVHDAPRRNLAIATDGTFADVERFRYRAARTIQYDTERFSGRIGAGGASGTFSIVSRLANRDTGRTIGTCRTGTVAWTAAP